MVEGRIRIFMAGRIAKADVGFVLLWVAGDSTLICGCCPSHRDAAMLWSSFPSHFKLSTKTVYLLDTTCVTVPSAHYKQVSKNIRCMLTI